LRLFEYQRADPFSLHLKFKNYTILLNLFRVVVGQGCITLYNPEMICEENKVKITTRSFLMNCTLSSHQRRVYKTL
jgi:hypothetical protein